MYSAVSSRDALRRFFGNEEGRKHFAQGEDQREFGRVVVLIADRLEARLKSQRWDVLLTRTYDAESLLSMSVHCLRSIGSEVQSSENGLILNRQLVWTLLTALTALLERLEGETYDAPVPVRTRRFLSHPKEIIDPHAPLELGEQVGDY